MVRRSSNGRPEVGYGRLAGPTKTSRARVAAASYKNPTDETTLCGADPVTGAKWGAVIKGHEATVSLIQLSGLLEACLFRSSVSRRTDRRCG